jgi:sialate O-acetylesterase
MVVQFLLVFLAIVACPSAGIRFSNVLGDNMVLQRAPQQALVWGYTTPHDIVTLTFGNFSNNASADSNGEFRMQLPQTSAGGPFTIMATSHSSGEKALLQNVMFGDVFFCSGQSNMQFTLPSVFNATEEEAKANSYPHIRVMTVGQKTASPVPLTELKTIEQVDCISSTTISILSC